jgi:hypothetical protein
LSILAVIAQKAAAPPLLPQAGEKPAPLGMTGSRWCSARIRLDREIAQEKPQDDVTAKFTQR